MNHFDQLNTSIDADRLMALQMAQEDFKGEIYPIEVVLRRADDYLKWLQK